MTKNRSVKTMALIVISAVMVLACAFASFADDDYEGYYIGNSEGWQPIGDGGWRYVKSSDGLMLSNEWAWIGEEDTGYNRYFFDRGGTLVTNTFTVDGFRVNENGQWVDDFGVPVTRMLIATTRAPFGNEVTNGYAAAPITLGTHLSSLIDVRNSASGFLSRKYIKTMENGDTLFYGIDNDTQIKLQINSESVAGIEAPARLIFSNFPDTGIELNALYQNMSGSLISTNASDVSEEDLAAYFEAEPYSFSYAGMIVMADRNYDVYICLTTGTDGRSYVYPNSPTFMRLHIDFVPDEINGPAFQ